MWRFLINLLQLDGLIKIFFELSIKIDLKGYSSEMAKNLTILLIKFKLKVISSTNNFYLKFY